MLSLFALLSILASPPPASADSARSDNEIREVVLRHATAVRACYESEGLRRNTDLAGTLEVELRILPVGRVDSVAVVHSELHGPGTREVTECIVRVARNWRFERGPFGVEDIVLPFVLKPERNASQGGADESRRGS
jgi:outer membrane biosynthesis protein TonB